MKYLITGRVARDHPVEGLTKDVQHLIPVAEFDATIERALEILGELRRGTFYFDLHLWNEVQICGN